MLKRIKSFKNLVIASSICLAALACSENGGDNIKGENNVKLQIDAELFNQVEKKRVSGKGSEESDDFTIKNVVREGDMLKIDVQYVGGCKDHAFDILWNGGIMESSPCQVNLIVSHDAKGDDCLEPVNETLEINLKNLYGNDSSDAFTCLINTYSLLNSSDNPDETVTSTTNN